MAARMGLLLLTQDNRQQHKRRFPIIRIRFDLYGKYHCINRNFRSAGMNRERKAVKMKAKVTCMKRRISVLLCVSLLAAAGVGCGNSTEQAVSDTQPTSAEPAVTEKVIPLCEADFGAADIRILAAAEQWQDFYTAEQTGDAINDAVYTRNRSVEERYHVKLNYQVYNGYGAGTADVRTALTGSVMGGSAEFDLMVGGISYITPYVMDNLFTDLYTLDALQTDQPWWFADVNREIEIGGHLYLGSGYYGMLTMANAVVTFFNKQVAEDYKLEDLYAAVNSGEWTFDKMTALAKDVSADLNGDGTLDAMDRVGILSTSDYMAFLVNAMGHFYTEHTDTGTILLQEPTEQLLSVVVKLAELQDDDLFLDGGDHARMGESFQTSDDMYNRMLAMFAADQSLFLLHRLEFSTRETLRNMENYGILPLPKYDEQQKDYLTPIVNDVAAVPGVVADTQMSAVILEALQYFTYDIVRPQYYEVALKRKGTRDDASENMLDLIFEHTVCDFAYMFSDSIGQDLFYGVSQKNYASWAEKNYKKFRINIENIVKTVEGFES